MQDLSYRMPACKRLRVWSTNALLRCNMLNQGTQQQRPGLATGDDLFRRDQTEHAVGTPGSRATVALVYFSPPAAYQEALAVLPDYSIFGN